jgi:RNA polymerase sigma-70 factor (TIGR02943 family)
MSETTTKLNSDNWVKNYADYLYHFAFYRVGDEEAANDLVQDTFLSALENEHTYAGRSSELTWLTVILRNKIIDHYRKKASGLNSKTRLSNFEEDNVDYFGEDGIWKPEFAPKPFGSDGHHRLVMKEFYTILEFCLQKLPPLWMAAFKMKHLDEEKTATICQSLRVTLSNYFVIIHRAKLNLRECLQKNWI